jgi:hypothetical protein
VEYQGRLGTRQTRRSRADRKRRPLNLHLYLRLF